MTEAQENELAGMITDVAIDYANGHAVDFRIAAKAAVAFVTDARPVVIAPKVAVPKDVMEARAQGRSEALAIILGLDAESGLDEYADSFPCGDTGDYSAEWNEEKLRELLRADDAAYSLLQEAEGHYWEQLGYSEEAKRNYELSATTTREVPPQIGESDAAYWIANRAAIIDAISKSGFKLMSNKNGFWLLNVQDDEPQTNGEPQ